MVDASATPSLVEPSPRSLSNDWSDPSDFAERFVSDGSAYVSSDFSAPFRFSFDSFDSSVASPDSGPAAPRLPPDMTSEEQEEEEEQAPSRTRTSKILLGPPLAATAASRDRDRGSGVAGRRSKENITPTMFNKVLVVVLAIFGGTATF